VKIVMTREEVIAASRPAPASIINVKMGVTEEGRITAAYSEIIFDLGAFPERPYSSNAALHALGPYKIPNLKIEGFDVLTNTVPAGSYRAPAAPPAAFAVESHMDSIAHALGMDPLEFRIRNAVEKGDVRPDGKILPRIGFKETLERMAEYLTRKGKLEGENRGRGIACGFWCGGIGNYSAHVNVNPDGSVNLLVGSVDLTGNRTSMAQIAAEEFCIPFEKVTVATGDTDTAPYSDLTVGSRATYHMGITILRACRDAKTQLARQAASILAVNPAEVEFVRGRFQIKGKPKQSISLEELAYNSTTMPGEGPITGHGAVGKPPQNPMFAVHAADVEVDRDTGKVKVLSYTAAQDVGFAINPTLVEGQIQGAIAQGVGWALMEDYVVDNGVVQNTTLLDYRMPTAVDLPFKDILLVEVPSETGPYGMRPVGEPPMIPCLAAVSNAINSAVGVRIKELPVSPEALFRALRAQEREE
jgi:CO/xanthine dehydrogenase Mo-binding subunit